MPTWRLRDFHDDDLDRAVQIWDQDRQAAESALPVFPVSEVMAAAGPASTAVVAVVGDELVGMAVAQAHGRAGLDHAGGAGRAVAQPRDRQRPASPRSSGACARQGVRRIGALLPPGATGATALENSGYRHRATD